MKSEQRVCAIIIIYERRNVVVSRRKSRPDSFCIKIREAGSRPPNAFVLKCFLHPHLENNFPSSPLAQSVQSLSPFVSQYASLPLQRPGPAGAVSGCTGGEGLAAAAAAYRRIRAHLSPFLALAMFRNKGSSENGVYHRNDNISQMLRREISRNR